MSFSIKIVIFFLLSAAVSANASGIKVNPPKLEITAKLNESLTREITVTNPTSDVQIFKVYPDDFADIIKASPSSFTLEAGANKAVTVTVGAENAQNSSETFNTNLSIVAKPLAETGFQTNAGVKIPLSITVYDNNSPSRIPQQAYYALILAALFAIAAFAHFRRRKKMAL